jgi:hypothetical protein
MFILSRPVVSRSAIAFALFGLCHHALAVEDSEDVAKQRRLQFLTRKADDLQLSFAAEPERLLPLTKPPVLRFSNPVRDSFGDGAIFLWLSGRRPIAAASLWIRANGEFGQDFSSLSDAPLRCVRDDKIAWSPKTGILVNRPIDDAPEPGQTPQRRLSQMRQLARRFKGSIGAWPAEGFRELRLLTRPIYRYSSEDHKVIDGAVFALALANDPEALVMVELTRNSSDGQAVWRFSLARMSAVRMIIRLDDREVWAADGYWRKPRSLNDPYIELLGEKYSPAATK